MGDEPGGGDQIVTLNCPSWEEATLVWRRAGAINAIQETMGRTVSPVNFRCRNSWPTPTCEQESNPRRIARIIDAVNGYDRLLRVLSVRHEHVVQNPNLQAIYSLRKLSLFLVRLPSPCSVSFSMACRFS